MGAGVEDSRQDALLPDDLNKLMNSVVFFDLDEVVRVTNKAIERGNHTCEVDGCLDKGHRSSSKSALKPADAEACLYCRSFIAAVPRSGPERKFALPVRQQEQDSDKE